MHSPLILSLSLSLTRGSASAEPPGCSSPSLSLLDGAAVLLLLAPERLLVVASAAAVQKCSLWEYECTATR